MRVAIVGTSDSARRLSGWIESHPSSGMRLAGVCDDGARLLEMVKRDCVEVVVVALPPERAREATQIIHELGDTTTTVYVTPPLPEHQLGHARALNVGGVSLLGVYETPFRGMAALAKRIEDLLLGSLMLAVVALPMLGIAAAVKLSSPGPVLFRQRRYGLNGEEIRVLKFRTMTVCEDGTVIPQAREDDERVTRVGAILRRTSLDELPQLLHVLSGKMSMVGPRPHAVAHNELYRRQIHGYMQRHKVRPGMTGLAQINGWRGETSELEKMVRRVQHDLAYIRNWSLLLDLKILALTLLLPISRGPARAATLADSRQ
jgi:putative colanic acid biosynthesis UDP-glucose lipid carrier transferase